MKFPSLLFILVNPTLTLNFVIAFRTDSDSSVLNRLLEITPKLATVQGPFATVAEDARADQVPVVICTSFSPRPAMVNFPCTFSPVNPIVRESQFLPTVVTVSVSLVVDVIEFFV